MLTEKTLITFKNTSVQPREIETPLNGYAEWQAPDANYQERVYYHQPQGVPEVQIINPDFPFYEGVAKVQASLQWSVDTLPRLVQWKMPGAGTHVLGIEPANCYVEGRHKERDAGTLIFLEPGETVKYELRLDLS